VYDLRNRKHVLVYATEVHKVEFCLYRSHSIVRLKYYQGNGNVDLKELGFGDMNWEGFSVLMCLAAEATNHDTVRSESRCALRLRYVDFVVSIEAGLMS
jgi:hypothetical protein